VQTVANAFIELLPTDRRLESEEDVRRVVGLCFEKGLDRLLLHGDNLPEEFFELASGFAGRMLQLLRNYHIRMALVLAGDDRIHGRFQEMVTEENRGKTFRVFATPDAAAEWLALECP
jgi:PadR family transcriptional regulator, regulatory protein AphA